MKMWIHYLLIPIPLHVLLGRLAVTDTFADGPLGHFWVRMGIALLVTLIVAGILERRRAVKTES